MVHSYFDAIDQFNNCSPITTVRLYYSKHPMILQAKLSVMIDSCKQRSEHSVRHERQASSCAARITLYIKGLAINLASVMSVVIQDRFREHVAVAEALRANYSSKDDVNRIYAIQQLEIELSELCRRQENDIQATLRGDNSCHLVM
jgi:transcriptional regulator NrdR family protein